MEGCVEAIVGHYGQIVIWREVLLYNPLLKL